MLTIDMRWNSAGPTGAHRLLPRLGGRLGLAVLLFVRAGGHTLAEGLERNFALLRLPLQGNRVADDTLRRIEALLVSILPRKNR